jgi:L-serine dehydratase
VSTLLAREGDNIATMRVSRRTKGGQAIHIYELDAPASAGALAAMRAVPAIVMLRSIQRVA